MSHHNQGKRILPHDLKYPLFLLGFAVIIIGGLSGIKLGLGIYEDAAIAAVGFIMMLLGIILE